MSTSNSKTTQHHNATYFSQTAGISSTHKSSSGKIKLEPGSLRIPSNEVLGIIAMMCSPFLFMEMLSDHKLGLRNTSAAGIADLIYMIGWICSIIGLIKQDATGNRKWGKRLLRLNLVFLGVACIWNIWSVVDPTNSSTLYRVLDFFWPASNTLFFITGIVIAAQKKLSGVSRWIPLTAGFWLGFALIFGTVTGGGNDLSFYSIGAYSVIAWFLLGLSIYKSEEAQTV